eukprot:m.108973 g.108973  ORF g.108973 m.108973 type:complete len:204 (-) comp27922_c0_seq2:372-983(-)
MMAKARSVFVTLTVLQLLVLTVHCNPKDKYAVNAGLRQFKLHKGLDTNLAQDNTIPDSHARKSMPADGPRPGRQKRDLYRVTNKLKAWEAKSKHLLAGKPEVLAAMNLSQELKLKPGKRCAGGLGFLINNKATTFCRCGVPLVCKGNICKNKGVKSGFVVDGCPSCTCVKRTAGDGNDFVPDVSKGGVRERNSRTHGRHVVQV